VDVPQDAGWDEWVAEVHRFVRGTFVLATDRKNAVWQYIMALAAELEYLTVVTIWLADGKPVPLEDYEARLTLGLAARRVEDRQLLETATVETLMAVAHLRNNVRAQKCSPRYRSERAWPLRPSLGSRPGLEHHHVHEQDHQDRS